MLFLGFQKAESFVSRQTLPVTHHRSRTGVDAGAAQPARDDHLQFAPVGSILIGDGATGGGTTTRQYYPARELQEVVLDQGDTPIQVFFQAPVGPMVVVVTGGVAIAEAHRVTAGIGHGQEFVALVGVVVAVSQLIGVGAGHTQNVAVGIVGNPAHAVGAAPICGFGQAVGVVVGIGVCIPQRFCVWHRARVIYTQKSFVFIVLGIIKMQQTVKCVDL